MASKNLSSYGELATKTSREPINKDSLRAQSCPCK